MRQAPIVQSPVAASKLRFLSPSPGRPHLPADLRSQTGHGGSQKCCRAMRASGTPGDGCRALSSFIVFWAAEASDYGGPQQSLPPTAMPEKSRMLRSFAMRERRSDADEVSDGAIPVRRESGRTGPSLSTIGAAREVVRPPLAPDDAGLSAC